MRFKFNGNEYRIVFRHDPSEKLGAHVGHHLSVRRSFGQLRVVCDYCEGALIFPLSKKKDIRNTDCYVQINIGIAEHPYWVKVYEGRSKLNVKEGDIFSKKGGREASLADAIGKFSEVEDGSFADAAWAAYCNRGQR